MEYSLTLMGKCILDYEKMVKSMEKVYWNTRLVEF